MTTTIERAATRVRHEVRMRLLEVRRVERLTPRMLRVALAGDQLAGFVSAAHDDHAKIFFPTPGERRPVMPTPGPNGPVWPEGVPRPTSRDYTPRRYDEAAGELLIDFALHGEGPAADWARQATPGQQLGVGGPRGSFVVSDDFDWYLLVGDESALPAIGRRLEELPAGSRAVVIAEVADSGEELPLPGRARTETLWLHRGEAPAGTADRLLPALAGLALPPGDGYAWVAAEASVAKTLRQHLVETRRQPKEWVKAAAYWKHGAAAVHETYND